MKKLIDQMRSELKKRKCLSSKTDLIILSSYDKKDNSILFNSTNVLNLMIDINQFSLKSIDYDLILPMINNQIFEKKLKLKLDKSFLVKHKHPSEEIVFTFKIFFSNHFSFF